MKNALIIGWVWVTLLAGLRAEAQINESDTLALQLRASLSGVYQKGNVALLALRGRLDLSVMPAPKWVLKSQNVSLYQSFYSNKADNDLFSRNFLYFSPNSRLYPYAIAFVSGNFRRKIRWRYFSGLGLTWQAFRAPGHVLKLSGNVVYEETLFGADAFNQARYNGNSRLRFWRASTYLSGQHVLAKGKLRVYYDAFWMPALAEGDNHRTQVDAGLDLGLWRGLALSATYGRQFEGVTPLGVRNRDEWLLFGLLYRMDQKHFNKNNL
jgi:hypothetical protein